VTKGEAKMTDRIKGLWVALDKEIRDDDVEVLVNAIKMLKHVENVTSRKVQPDDWMMRNKIRGEIREKVIEIFDSLK
jgi:hypothetical protein